MGDIFGLHLPGSPGNQLLGQLLHLLHHRSQQQGAVQSQILLQMNQYKRAINKKILENIFENVN